MSMMTGGWRRRRLVWAVATSIRPLSHRPLSTSAELLEFGNEHMAQGIGRLSEDMLVEKGEGCWITDSSGRRFLDCTSGIGVTNLGHCHPKVVRAAQKQMGRLMHGQVNIAFHKPMLTLVDKLAHHVMPFGLDTFFFWNSGAEAVEAALKLARHATRKHSVIVFQGGYHGRTIGTMSLTTSKTIYRAGYGPLMPGVHVAPFPYTARWKQWHKREDEEEAMQRCSEQCLAEFEVLLKQQANPCEVAAVLIEPVLGEGGYVVPPAHFLNGLRQLCDQHGLLLIFDEVQSGFGRTGKFFACEHFDVAPDILVFAKGIASGLPLSGIASTKRLMDFQPKGSQGGTYAGNAVACAAANATIDVMVNEGVLENTIERGDELQQGLRALHSRFPEVIKEVRGLGLMVGLEFHDQHHGIAARISKE